MITLQEQFEKDFPNKKAREINVSNGSEYRYANFTNYDLDLRGYKYLTYLNMILTIQMLMNLVYLVYLVLH